MSWPKVVLFGDSITQFSFSQGGWGAAVADALQRKCDVLNRGFSGYNTSWARFILRQCFPGEMLTGVALVTLFFGANDASLKEVNRIQHVTLDDYRTNMKAILQYFIDGGLQANQVILITPPPLGEEKWAVACMEKYGSPINRSNANTGLYAKACCSVAQEFGTGLLDLWTSMQEDKHWLRFFNDGLHLSQDGSTFVAERLVKIVKERTSTCPRCFRTGRTLTLPAQKRASCSETFMGERLGMIPSKVVACSTK
ncbi:isoamyl acetate-hydrolyzing esterase 1 homolog isoform X2 [Acanthaster planci]|uniref:Isoamyl acetate-hydrolyzing esterase 1 homolog n=1 Tax=Acanthaster planci TaxID=133434 RepID=A0A8B7YE74_ACAPL|nr:isoamyl acetate-hydrolyzing esterase 1 homolog isoform X2 [Acanthaster planci]